VLVRLVGQTALAPSLAGWVLGEKGRVGSIEVLNDDGDVIATTGREVSVGGGETNPTEVGGAAASDGWARELSGDQIPERCGSLYWLVSP
jgi:hypothetical protein